MDVGANAAVNASPMSYYLHDLKKKRKEMPLYPGSETEQKKVGSFTWCRLELFAKFNGLVLEIKE